MSRTLYVKPTTTKEVEEKWGFELPWKNKQECDFVRCNAKGVVNWDKTTTYGAKELVGRDKVVVIKDKGDADREDG